MTTSAAAPDRRTPAPRPVTRAGTEVAAAYGFGERGAEGVQLADPVEHGRDATGQHTVARTAGHAVFHFDVDAAEAVLAVADAGGGDCVGDERDSPGCGVPDHLDDLVGKVLAVEDHLHDDIVPGECRAGQPGVAVGEGPHCVEEVGDRADAVVECSFGFGSGRVRVPTGDDDTALMQEVDEIERAFELGSEGHLGNRARIEQSLEESAIGIASRRLRVSS